MMRVVVTRPAARSAPTAEKLARMGHEAILLPLGVPRHDPEAAVQALARQPAGLVVTSAEAIRVLQSLGPLDARILALPVFAVGAATARAARALGFGNVREGDGDGAALARLVLSMPVVGRLAYLAGAPRSPGFEEAMAAAGQGLDVSEVYAVDYAAPDPVLVTEACGGVPPDVILFYSAEAAKAFLALDLPIARPGGASTLFACLSPTIAAIFPATLSDRIRVASRPDEDALLDLI